MHEKTHTSTVIRYKDYDNDHIYVGTVSTGSYDSLYINESYTLEDAFDFSDQDSEYIVSIYDQFQRDNPSFECEVVRITVKTTIEDVMDGSDVYKELRQKTALSKLTEKEIKALGLTNIAVYIKTKYHNA